MHDFIITHYLWFKSFHVMAMIFWVMGLILLPKLFFYHVSAKAGDDCHMDFRAFTLKIKWRPDGARMDAR